MLTEIREIRVQKSTCTRIAYWGFTEHELHELHEYVA